MDEINKLILGDNLEILKNMERESVDLIYLDPPFFSNRNYEVIWGDAGEIRSFKDRWSGGIEHYITWLKERVEEMHRVLKQTGSIFLHCDWHADAYIRVDILDKIFGKNCFRNQIIWHYFMGGKPKYYFANKHDTIFFYTKSPKNTHTFNEIYTDRILPYTPNLDTNTSLKQKKCKSCGKDSGIWISEVKLDDVWDMSGVFNMSKERIGYPTQKPESLLERIIKSASNKGDIILDPFVGGGTTVAVADKLGRKWIGIDQSVQAVKVSEFRLNKQQGMHDAPFSVYLHKYDYDTLRNKPPFEFESWIIAQFGGTPNIKQRNDLGLDGKTSDGKPIQVKRSDNIGRIEIDKFKSAIERYDKKMYENNKKTKEPAGYIIAFSFGKGAVEEVARLQNKENIIIKLIKVEDIVEISRKPIIKINGIKELEKDEQGNIKIEFDIIGESDAGIEFYSWDFNYDEEKGYKPTILFNKDDKQIGSFDAGIHNIAVKVVDNNGLDSINVIKLKINGGISVR